MEPCGCRAADGLRQPAAARAQLHSPDLPPRGLPQPVVDWPAAARECVAVLRLEAGQHRDVGYLDDLVSELGARSAELREQRADYRVAGPRQLVKTLDHPIAGKLTVDVRHLSVDTGRDQFMATLTGHGTDSRAALRFLLQWSSPADRPEPARTARGGQPAQRVTVSLLRLVSGRGRRVQTVVTVVPAFSSAVMSPGGAVVSVTRVSRRAAGVTWAKAVRPSLLPSVATRVRRAEAMPAFLTAASSRS
ncbi:hypothetical protein GTY64_22730 [Streptomyces sp. SID8376]|nr:hypothetical protein [Streptomyces sp. XHT-2]MYQ32241.1 hypothetical protein [Streptomyces sp. SID4956]MYW54237.1 hypothetical protein [Streptomyces sp. SID8376]